MAGRNRNMTIKIDINKVDKENFKITECEITGEKCYLINPLAIFANWNEDNLIFRSSLWNSEGYLISAGFPKFFNLEEKPSIHPFDGDISRCSIIEKIDGSCLIVSKYNGEFIIRTRGTVDARKMANGKEIDLFLDRFENSSLNNKEEDTWPYSLLFEWVSPDNQIVIKYNEPDFYYLNSIDHYIYSLSHQHDLDHESEQDRFENGKYFKRPNRYRYSSLEEMLDKVGKFEGKEGVIICYDKDQHMRKCKSKNYLMLHAFKSRCNLNTMIDLFFEWGKPTKDIFVKKIENIFDFEAVKFAESFIEDLYKAVDKMNNTIDSISLFVSTNKLLDQKDFALKIKDLDSSVKAIAFSLRKGSVIEKAYRNLLESYI